VTAKCRADQSLPPSTAMGYACGTRRASGSLVRGLGSWTRAPFLAESVQPMSFSLRVAIADDDRGMRESLEEMLRHLGHEVVAVASNGESLVNQCAMAQPDVVITGTLTPEMYGSDAAAVVYQSRPIPIILYSSHCEPDLVLNAEHKHVFLYLVKPICEEHLQAALKECNKCRCWESNEPSDGDEKNVPVGVPAGSFRRSLSRGPSRPPYRQLPR
jgi:PleD family two-component response regulator